MPPRLRFAPGHGGFEPLDAATSRRLRPEKARVTAAINPLARKFSIATIIFARIHRVLEWLDALRFEQHFLGRLPDIVADALLPWVGFPVLRDPRATGILCGARGFTL